MVRKVDRELKLEAIRMASLAQLPGRVPQPLRVHRDLLQPRKESLHPVLRITRPIRAAHIHNRRLRVSVFPGEYQEQTPVRTYIHMARFVPGVLCIVVRRHNLLLWRNMQVPCETSPGIHSPRRYSHNDNIQLHLVNTGTCNSMILSKLGAIPIMGIETTEWSSLTGNSS